MPTTHNNGKYQGLESIVEQALQTNNIAALDQMLQNKIISVSFRIRAYPLLCYAAMCSPEIVDYLLSQPDIDINQPSSHGRTPVAYSAITRQTTILRKLLDRGADPNIEKCTGGTTPLFSACSRPNMDEIIDILLNDPRTLVNTKPPSDPFVAAIAGGHLSYVEKLLTRQDVDLTSPRDLLVLRPHDTQQYVLVVPPDRDTNTLADTMTTHVLKGSIIDFAREMEEKYGANGITEYLTKHVEKQSRARSSRLAVPKTSGSLTSSSLSWNSRQDQLSLSRESRHSRLSHETPTSRSDRLQTPLLLDEDQRELDDLKPPSPPHSDSGDSLLLDDWATNSSDADSDGDTYMPPILSDAVPQPDSFTSVLRKLVLTSPITSLSTRSLPERLEEKRTRLEAAHTTMMAMAKLWYKNFDLAHDSSPNKHLTRIMCPALREFIEAPDNQARFEKLVTLVLNFNPACLGELQRKDFQLLTDTVLDNAAKWHDYQEITKQQPATSQQAATAQQKPQVRVSFAPLFRAALAATHPKNQSTESLAIPPTKTGHGRSSS